MTTTWWTDDDEKLRINILFDPCPSRIGPAHYSNVHPRESHFLEVTFELGYKTEPTSLRVEETAIEKKTGLAFSADPWSCPGVACGKDVILSLISYLKAIPDPADPETLRFLLQRLESLQ